MPPADCDAPKSSLNSRLNKDHNHDLKCSISYPVNQRRELGIGGRVLELVFCHRERNGRESV
jgi:hypothetical protein